MAGQMEIRPPRDQSAQHPDQGDVQSLVRVDDHAIASTDVVDEASTESFPASDPPPWTLGVEPR